METSLSRWSEIFLARRPAPAPSDPAALEARLADLCGAARRTWPGVDLSAAMYVDALASRAEPDLDPCAALARLHAADIYLAVACARGDPGASAHFEQRFVSLLPAVLSSLPKSGTFLDDARQQLRQRLLVGEDGPPRIATYSGRGPLEGWFRAAALRLALNLRRSELCRPVEVALHSQAAAPSVDAEAALARARYQGDFQASLRAALSRLDARQRMLMRWHFFDALPLSQIAVLEGVSKSTVGRWLAAAREDVLTRAREELKQRVGVPSSQLNSLVRVLMEGADATLNDLLSRAR